MEERLQAVFTLNDNAFARGTDRILAMLNRIDQRTTGLERNLRNSFESPLGSISKLSGGLFAVDNALGLIKQGLQITSNFERLDSGISNVSTSSLDFAHTQAYLQKLSDELGISIEDLQESYKGLKAATNGTNLQGVQTEKIFSAVVRAGATLKLSNEDVKGTILALTQMISKGVVGMDEMRQQLGDRLPGAFELAAKAMGVHRDQLIKMISSGEVLADDLLPKLATELEKTYGEKAQSNVNSMAGGWARATNQLKLYIAEFSKTNGIDTFAAKVGNIIANLTKDARRAQSGSFKTDVDEFMALSLEDQKKARAQLMERMVKDQARLNKLSKAPFSDSGEEAKLDKRMQYFKKLYGAFQSVIARGEWEQPKVNNVVNPNEQAVKYLEKLRDRYSELTKARAGFLAQNKKVPASLAADIKDVETKLRRAEVIKTPKQTFLDESKFGVLNLNKRIAARLEREIQDAGGKNVEEKQFQLAALRREIERLEALTSKDERVSISGLNPTGREEIEKPIKEEVLGVKLDPVSYKTTNQQVQGIVDNFHEIAKVTPGLFSKTGASEFLNAFQRAMPTLDYYQNKIAEIKGTIANLTLAGLGDSPQVKALISQLEELKKALKGAQDAANAADAKTETGDGNDSAWIERAQRKIDAWKAAGKEVKATALELAEGMKQAAVQIAQASFDMLSSFGEALGKGEDPLQSALRSFTSFIGDYLIKQGEALAMAAILTQTAAVAAGPFAPLLALPAAGQFAAAAALIVGGAAIKGISSHEKGGLFTGEKIIRVGETQKALKGGGEWVAPVALGADLISERINKNILGFQNASPSSDNQARSIAQYMGAFNGGGRERLVTRLTGREIEIILVRENTSNQQY